MVVGDYFLDINNVTAFGYDSLLVKVTVKVGKHVKCMVDNMQRSNDVGVANEKDKTKKRIRKWK